MPTPALVGVWAGDQSRSHDRKPRLHVHHNFRSSPKVVIIEDSVVQIPEGCTDTAYTVLNFGFNCGLLG